MSTVTVILGIRKNGWVGGYWYTERLRHTGQLPDYHRRLLKSLLSISPLISMVSNNSVNQAVIEHAFSRRYIRYRIL